MATDKFRLKNGALSQYALSCGYIDVVRHNLLDVEVHLSDNGCTYDVHVSGPELQARYPHFIPMPSGGRICAGWAQFDSLTEARQFQRKLARMDSVQAMVEAALEIMAY